MKTQLSIQEKLEDLRKERKLTQDTVAAAVGITGSTLSKYENKENKEYNIAILNNLADYYGVSLEWLVGNTEIRESTSTEIDELMLDDETIELLKSGRFNNRLFCEIIKHPDFIKLMTDTEIYVDGIATMQIKNMNDWLDAIRLQIKKNTSSIPFTAIGTILSALYVKTTNTLPNPHQSKDLCPTIKRYSVSCKPSNSRVILLRNSGVSSVMRCRFRSTTFLWMNIRL